MKASALTLSMILILVPLAGCSGTDTEVSVDLSNEDINDLIDENLEDVMNNTTVVVFQEYNNNTSVVNNNNAYHNDTYHNNNTVVMQPSTTKVMSGTLAGIESIDDMPAVAAVVREDRYTSGDNLNGANICVGIGTELESDFQDWFNDGNIDFTSVPVSDQAEATQKLRDGECDAMATTMYEAQAISESINSDETIDLSTWVASPGSHDGPPYSVRNSVTFQIHQANDELISRPFYDFTLIELHLICIEGATNCENVTLTASSYNDVNIDYYLNNDNIEVITVCENGIVFSNPHGYFYEHQGTGMNCTHNWNYQIEIPLNTIPEWDFSMYTFEWSEWTYSFAYTSETMEVVSS